MQYADTGKSILRLLFSLSATLPGVLLAMGDTDEASKSLFETFETTGHEVSSTEQPLSPAVDDQHVKQIIEHQNAFDKNRQKAHLDQIFARLLLSEDQGAGSNKSATPNKALTTETMAEPLHQDDREKIELVSRMIAAARLRLGVHELFIEKEQELYKEVRKRADEEEAALKNCHKKQTPAAQQALLTKKAASIRAITQWHAKKKELDTWQATEKLEVNQVDQERLALLDPELVHNAAIRQLFQFDAKKFAEDAITTTRELTRLVTASTAIQEFLKEDDVLAKQQAKQHKAQQAACLTMQQAPVSIPKPQGSVRARRLSVVDEKE